MMSDVATITKPDEKPRYSPSETQRIRRETITEVVRQQYRALFQETEKVDLKNSQEVKRVAENYVTQCVECGALPSMQGLAAALGVGRSWLYEFMDSPSAKKTESVELLEKLRSAFTAMRLAANDRGAAPDTTTIFLLKNSCQGYRDQIAIEPVAPNNPLQDLNAEEARRRILEGIPDDDGTEEY